MAKDRMLTRIDFRVETNRRALQGTVRRTADGWTPALANERGHIFYSAGAVGGGIQPTAERAIEALLRDMVRIMGWEDPGPVRIR